MNEYTHHDQNNEPVGQAAANNTLPPSKTLVSFGRGLPSLSKKLVDQFQANQYVDFSDLPLAHSWESLYTLSINYRRGTDRFSTGSRSC